MLHPKILKRSILLTILIIPIFSTAISGYPLYPDIRESAEIGPKGGSIMAEDQETGTSAGIFIQEGALKANTTITLILHGTRQPGVLGKTHINGISVLPKDLLFLEMARLEVYNPEVDVTKTMILYHVASEQFIIPLGSQEQHVDENYIEGTFYITGRFSLGTPTTDEASAQSKKLAAYNPVRPLAYAGEETDKQILLTAELDEMYAFHADGGPSFEKPYNYIPAPSCTSSADYDCLRWQKVLTQVEGHVTWMHQRSLAGSDQSAAAAAEQANAERTLKNGMESYLSKQSGANRCGGYLKAAEKYLETARSLGMNTEALSFIDQRYSQLINECAFEFSVETHEWINHPKEELADGATLEEKSNWYGTIRCFVPPDEFQFHGPKIAGEGTMTLHYENHWVGDEKEDHIITDGTWKLVKIEGHIKKSFDDTQLYHFAQADITLYWEQRITNHIWGRGSEGKRYDETGTETKSSEESRSYPLKNGFHETIGNKDAGRSIRIFIIRNPFDMKDDPNDCF